MQASPRRLLKPIYLSWLLVKSVLVSSTYIIVDTLSLPEYDRSVNPIQTRRADYAHHTTASPPRLKKLSTLLVQVNLFQKYLLLHQLTHNMTKDCPLNYQFSTWKIQAQDTVRICCVHRLFWMSKQKTICVQNIIWECSELWNFHVLNW